MTSPSRNNGWKKCFGASQSSNFLNIRKIIAITPIIYCCQLDINLENDKFIGASYWWVLPCKNSPQQPAAGAGAVHSGSCLSSINPDNSGVLGHSDDIGSSSNQNKDCPESSAGCCLRQGNYSFIWWQSPVIRHLSTCDRKLKLNQFTLVGWINFFYSLFLSNLSP